MSSRSLRPRKYSYIGLVYILPWLIGFTVFQLYPFVMSFVYSFTNYVLGRVPSFIGLANFQRMFTSDPYFFQSLKVTLLFVLIAVPGKIAFALFIAMLLKSKARFIGLFRTVYYVPSILGGSVAISVLWRTIFMKEGIVNHLLMSIGLQPGNWYGTPMNALVTISLLTIWQFGSSMVLFLAALKQIPAELYEAAQVDGAGSVRTFLRITLPMISPIILFNLVMQMINAFQEFTSAFVITGGGPLKGTYLFGMKLYEEAFANYRMGYASALSWVMFVIILLFTLVIFKSSSSWVHYEDGGK